MTRLHLPSHNPRKSNASVGTWQHHSGVDSFYGPPAGFTGPFISPPGSIPVVQGPPHMVAYNNFAPVGLSFMGTTYLPSGKQPDWKHSPVASSAMGVGEGDMNNLNMVSSQRNPTNMTASIQHLVPGSPLLHMASPLAMFDVSPFQSSSDISVQAQWSHVPTSPLQSVPMSMPLQAQASQFNHGPSVDHPLGNRFPESRTGTPSGATGTELPDELGLEPSISNDTNAVSAKKSSSTDAVQNGTNSGLKIQPSHQKSVSAQHYSNSSYQRGEWSHRRMGYQGRNQSVGAEKSFPPSKMKQIYVAKQAASSASTTS